MNTSSLRMQLYVIAYHACTSISSIRIISKNSLSPFESCSNLYNRFIVAPAYWMVDIPFTTH